MIKNIGRKERVGRIIAGTLLSSLAVIGPKNKFFLSGLLLAVDGAIGVCPVYSVLGISTNKKKHKTVEEEANDYFPVESSSEQAAGHPIVGAS